MTILCMLYASMYQKDNEILQDRIMRLRADSVLLDCTAKRFIKWHYQLDSCDKQEIDSIVKSDKQRRVK
ncbi:MAG: hypothetical protein JU82_05185 [Sulfuricurvum sp. MLSB]|nr:MAG: hypothetical protein JU82_05185 [Sulfuricurvum sp. MLSB]